MEFHADTIMQHTNFCYVLPNDFIMEEIRLFVIRYKGV